MIDTPIDSALGRKIASLYHQADKSALIAHLAATPSDHWKQHARAYVKHLLPDAPESTIDMAIPAIVYIWQQIVKEA